MTNPLVYHSTRTLLSTSLTPSTHLHTNVLPLSTLSFYFEGQRGPSVRAWCRRLGSRMSQCFEDELRWNLNEELGAKGLRKEKSELADTAGKLKGTIACGAFMAPFLYHNGHLIASGR
ncbi:hypothetical protein EV361DRAFT_867589 [Lentinula raphanica]|nr:hypothetical protein EV361DRAFT_867589 [Lentinula raphanica]